MKRVRVKTLSQMGLILVFSTAMRLFRLPLQSGVFLFVLAREREIDTAREVGQRKAQAHKEKGKGGARQRDRQTETEIGIGDIAYVPGEVEGAQQRLIDRIHWNLQCEGAITKYVCASAHVNIFRLRS